MYYLLCVPDMAYMTELDQIKKKIILIYELYQNFISLN